MDPEGSLSCSQEPSTGTFSETDQSSPNRPSQLPILMLSTNLRLGPHSGLFPSGFPTNVVYAFLFSPISALFLENLIFPRMFILIILGKECKLWSSSLCSFL
jgi:hypothetical protein